MKNCSCIFAKQRNGDDLILFEGNHPIPFFWLMLLGKEDVERFRLKMSPLSEEDAAEQDTSIELDKLSAISRAADRRDYIKQFMLPCLPLFDDWLYFMQVSDFADMKIYVDVYSTGSSSGNINQFCDSLLRAIVCFDDNIEAWHEVSIPATCGYEGRNGTPKRFSDYSNAYRELNQKDIYGRFDKKLHLNSKRSFFKKRWLLVILLLLFALLVIGVILSQA